MKTKFLAAILATSALLMAGPSGAGVFYTATVAQWAIDSAGGGVIDTFDLDTGGRSSAAP